jgi:glutamine synthetase
MSGEANPQDVQSGEGIDTTDKQTFEMRSPDGSADLYQLIAGLCVGLRHGFEMQNPLEVAKQTYVDVNIHDAENADRLSSLASLPDSCWASADCLEHQRAVYEEYDVFSKAMIDGIIRQLKSFNDKTLRADIEGDQEKVAQLVQRFFHCG